MRILLINPPNSGRSIPEEHYGMTSIKMILKGEPLSLETLAGNLTGHDVKILDLKVEPDSLEDTVEVFRPDIVGITCVTCEANTVVKISDTVRRLTGAIVVVGGHHPTLDPDFFNRSSIDYVVTGVGKASFKELVDAVHDKDGRSVDGIFKTQPGGTMKGRFRNFSDADLVDEKPPRYDLVRDYRHTYVMGGIGEKIGFVTTAYGCTHTCSFCSIPKISGFRYLVHSEEAILRDMAFFEDIQYIRFVDANTFGDVKASTSLARRVIDQGLKKKILVDVRSDTIVNHRSLIELWKEAGLAVAVIGLEEIENQALNRYSKQTTVNKNIQALEILKEIGIKVIGDFIVSPDYLEADFDRLESFIDAHSIDLPMLTILTPVPGTPLYRSMKSRITQFNLDYYTLLNAVVPTKMEEEAFYEIFSGLVKKFHSHVTRS